MFKEQSEIDELGAEALPGGFAEMQRMLQLALDQAVADRRIAEGRDVAVFFTRRTNGLDIA